MLPYESKLFSLIQEQCFRNATGVGPLDHDTDDYLTFNGNEEF